MIKRWNILNRSRKKQRDASTMAVTPKSWLVSLPMNEENYASSNSKRGTHSKMAGRAATSSYTLCQDNHLRHWQRIRCTIATWRRPTIFGTSSPLEGRPRITQSWILWCERSKKSKGRSSSNHNRLTIRGIIRIRWIRLKALSRLQ